MTIERIICLVWILLIIERIILTFLNLADTCAYSSKKAVLTVEVGKIFQKRISQNLAIFCYCGCLLYFLLYYHICGIDKCCERNWVKPKIIKSFLTFFHKFQDPWFLLNPSSWPINILHWNYCYWWALLLWLISFFPLM